MSENSGDLMTEAARASGDWWLISADAIMALADAVANQDHSLELISTITNAIHAAERRGALRERERIEKNVLPWLEHTHLSLHAGDVTAQEFRTAKAVVTSIASTIRQTD